MRPDRTGLAAVLLAATLGVAAVGAACADFLPRSALWAVVRSCVLAKASLGTPFPCLEVSPPRPGEPGFAVIRAPSHTTHIIVTPTDRISGIESPLLLQPEAGAYWRAALAARRLVVEASSGRASLDAVGLALNSERTRSQDQLHIHAECVRPEILQAIRAQSGEIGPAWRLLAHAVDRERLFARTVTAATLASDNLFAILAEIPGIRGDLSHVTTLVVAAGGGGGEPERFHVIAGSARSRTIEVYLDESCRAVSRRR